MQVELAYTLAKDAHRPQEREEIDKNGKRVRYFEHPRRVALILIDELWIRDPAIISGGLLHDVDEDTRYITSKHIEAWFGPVVAQIVRDVTKKPSYGYYERLLENGDWRSLFVKGADRLDNLRTLGSCKPEKQQRKIEETIIKIYPLLDRLVKIAPKKYRDSAKWLRVWIKMEVAKLKLKT